MSKHDFCRLHLNLTMKDVRKVVPVEIRKEAWTYKYHDGCCEFQIPSRKFYWYGEACCAWYARSQAWVAYMQEHHSKEAEEA